jgi:hypothetical protein
MNPTPPPDDLNEELMTRWIDGHLTPDLGGLLRQHLPSVMEPPSPEFFTSRIMEEIKGASVVTLPVARPAGFRSWLRQPWFAPLASAAAVALLFLAMNGARPGAAATSVARAYAPDPKVVANAFYSEEAGAVVIDLQGLEAVPDDREIRAYDVADAAPAAPGQPLVLHAATDPDRAILVLSPDASAGPRFRDLN